MADLFTDKALESEAHRLEAQVQAERSNQIMYHTFVTSRDGQKALKILRELFYDKSTYARGERDHSVYQQGQQDVVGFIIESIEQAKESV